MSPVAHDVIGFLRRKPGLLYWTVVTVLTTTVAVGVWAWVLQLRQGLVITGLTSDVMWGVYIVNFVFFVGISYAGTLLSAVLRLVGAEWRRPVTRVAEIVTVASLLVAGAMIFADLGRPGIAPLHFLKFARASSPLTWDTIVLSTYLFAALVFLYIPLVPDVALCRDLTRDQGGFRHWFYRIASLGWNGNRRQVKRLELAMGMVAVTIIPVAVLAHSVVAWIFGVNLRPVWNSTIFAPYFVVGAVFSGTAVILIVMAFYRYFAGFERYFTLRHFQNLALILLTLNLAYMYFTFSEYLTIGYAIKEEYRATLAAVLSGGHSARFWYAVVLGMVAPAFLVALPWTRTIPGITIASVLVVSGMWLKRWIIVVPPLEYTAKPTLLGPYTPTWVEWSITGAGFAALVLIFLFFQRVFPMISIWEMERAPAPGGEASPVEALAAHD
jgi:Ni/Fe-hydrogenase subunit HybB-like protein